MRMQAAVNSRTISEEALICMALNEDRHPNIMSSVALKKEVEEPWTGERVAKFIDRPQLRSEIVSLKSAKQKWPQKIAWEIPTRESVQFVEKVLAKPVSADPMNRMNPRYEFGIWLGMRKSSAECFIENADGVLRAREIRRLEPWSRWDKEAVNNEIGVLWRMTDGRWIVDSSEV